MPLTTLITTRNHSTSIAVAAPPPNLTTLLTRRNHSTSIAVAAPPPNLTSVVTTRDHAITYLAPVRALAAHANTMAANRISRATDHHTVIDAHVHFQDDHGHDLLAGTGTLALDGVSVGYGRTRRQGDHHQALLAPLRSLAGHSQRIDHLRSTVDHATRLPLAGVTDHAMQLLAPLRAPRAHAAAPPLGITTIHLNPLPARDRLHLSTRHAQHLRADTRYLRP